MIGPSYLLSENGDLSFLLFFSKQCLVENFQGKFQKNSSVNLISEESPKEVLNTYATDCGGQSQLGLTQSKKQGKDFFL